MIERFPDLELFTRIVDAGSLSAAARSLGMTQPTVSKRLAAMERELSARLIQRNTHRLQLTDEGKAWYDACARWITEMRTVSTGLHSAGGGLQGTLRINAPVTLGRALVAPLVRRFLELHPALSAELTLTDHRVDLVVENVDVAIRVGAIGNPSVVARQLFTYRTRLAAAPAYLAAHGTPRTVQEVLAHPILFYGTPLTEDLEGPGGTARLRATGRFHTNDGLTFVDALEEGGGLGLSSPWLLEPAFKRGSLVRVLPEAWGQRFAVSAIYLPSRVLPERVRAVMAFFKKELAAAVARFG